MELLRCSMCSKQISSPLPRGTQVRAWVSCYQCAESDTYIRAVHGLIDAIRFAAINADWCDPALADAIDFAEKYVPKHMLR